MKKTNIVFAGEGGQGIQTIAKIFAEGLIKSGFEANYLPSFGVEQRGTPSIAFVSFSTGSLHYSKFDNADFVIVLQKRAIDAIERYISPNTTVIFDSSTISENDLPKSATRLRGIPATKYAIEKFNPKSFNLLTLGFIVQIFQMNPKIVWNICEKILSNKLSNETVKQANKDAFEFGCEIVPEKNDFTRPIYRSSHKVNIYAGHGKRGEIRNSLCKGCGICLLKCPVGALSWGEDLGVYGNKVPVVDLEKCILCGNCHNFCPDGAILISKADKL